MHIIIVSDAIAKMLPGTLHSHTKRLNYRESSDGLERSCVHDGRWWEML